MLLSRRSLGLFTSAAAACWTLGGPRTAGAGPIAAGADVVGAPKTELPTPALVLDLDRFEANVARLSAHAAATGKRLRPHAKTHKCVAIARRQQAAGAIGVCVATVPEAEVMARGGIGGILLASPLASPGKARRIAELSREHTVTVAVDHPDAVAAYQHAADAAGTTLDVLVDLDLGDGRTGATSAEAALRLGEAVTRSSRLRLRGLQGYSGGSSHVRGFAARRDHSLAALAPIVALKQRFAAAGLPADILSGGSTGTWDIDATVPEVTELQCGSYVAMDAEYQGIGGPAGDVFDAFAPALGVLVTVVGTNHAGRATVDGGFKAFATDRPIGPVCRDLPGVTYRFRGDEFGILSWADGPPPVQRGDRVELIPPHCDPTVNLYDRIHACRGDRVEAVWSVMDRLACGGAAGP
jgi:3-hydroxy-D-aspartate aldolase